MKLKYSPFKLDKEFMIQRNNKLLKHYDQLNIIRNRKNLFLPKISSLSKNNIFSPKKTLGKNFKYKQLIQLKINEENEQMCNKIKEISNRPFKKVLPEQKLFFNLINFKKKSRNNIRKQNFEFLVKSNDAIRKRINDINPVINHKALALEYQKTRKIYKLNKKLKPCLSGGNNCLTRDDYSFLEKSKDSFSKDVKLKKIKIKKLGLFKKV